MGGGVVSHGSPALALRASVWFACYVEQVGVACGLRPYPAAKATGLNRSDDRKRSLFYSGFRIGVRNDKIYLMTQCLLFDCSFA
jgi:hypothetical protein